MKNRTTRWTRRNRSRAPALRSSPRPPPERHATARQVTGSCPGVPGINLPVDDPVEGERHRARARRGRSGRGPGCGTAGPVPGCEHHAAVYQRQGEERVFNLDEREVFIHRSSVSHSHSIVAGGFELMSYTTRLIRGFRS